MNSSIDKSKLNSLYFLSLCEKNQAIIQICPTVGEQFHGVDFDFLTFYQTELTDDTFDIAQIHISVGSEILELKLSRHSCSGRGPSVKESCTLDDSSELF